MSTEISDIKSKSLEFIDYLRSTDEYKAVLERFKEYLNTADMYKYHCILFDFDLMDYVHGEVYSIADRTDNLIILAHGYHWAGGVEIEPKSYY